MTIKSPSRIKGIAHLRKTLKRLPDAASEQMAAQLNKAGPTLAASMRALFPVLSAPRPHRTPGALAAGIMWKPATPKSLTLKVGLITKKTRSDLFYGHILDVGRMAQTVSVNRYRVGGRALDQGAGRRKNSALTTVYQMRVRGFKGLNASGKAIAMFRRDFAPQQRALLRAILTDAASGGNDDG